MICSSFSRGLISKTTQQQHSQMGASKSQCAGLHIWKVKLKSRKRKATLRCSLWGWPSAHGTSWTVRTACAWKSLPEFADQIQKLANWQRPAFDQSDEHYRINSIAGGIALLVVRHRTWLSQNSELEGWCLDTLQELKPVDTEDSPTSILSQSAELFFGEAGVALLPESSEEWVLRIAFEGVTGYYYNSTLYTMWRAYLLREQLGEKFGELVNLVVLWSALRRAAIAESGYHADRALLTKYKSALFRRYIAGRLKGSLISLRQAEIMGRRLIERISRRSSSIEERRMREELRESIQEDREHDHKLDRDIPDIDLAVIQKGFGFVAGMVRYPLPSANQTLHQYILELFEPGDAHFLTTGA